MIAGKDPELERNNRKEGAKEWTEMYLDRRIVVIAMEDRGDVSIGTVWQTDDDDDGGGLCHTATKKNNSNGPPGGMYRRPVSIPIDFSIATNRSVCLFREAKLEGGKGKKMK